MELPIKELSDLVREAIDKNNAMVSEMVAVYLKAHPELTIEDATLVNQRNDDGSTTYYIANQKLEPWKTLKVYEQDRAALLKLLGECFEEFNYLMQNSLRDKIKTAIEQATKEGEK